MKDADRAQISRKKGFIGAANFTGHPEMAIHYKARAREEYFIKLPAGNRS
jgi:hypothetical protein